MTKLVSLPDLALWALRSFRSSTLHYTNQGSDVNNDRDVDQGRDVNQNVTYILIIIAYEQYNGEVYDVNGRWRLSPTTSDPSIHY